MVQAKTLLWFSLFGLGTLTSARAGVIYTNFDPNNVVDNGFFAPGYVSSGDYHVDVAEAFTPLFTATLADIQLSYGSEVGGLSVTLRADNSGAPGAVIETFGGTFPTFNNAPVTTLLSILHPQLTAGQQYWIVLDPTPTLSGWGLWAAAPNRGVFADEITAVGPSGGAYLPQVGIWEDIDSNAIIGTLQVDSTPEPSTVSLFVAGFVLVGLTRGRLFRSQ